MANEKISADKQEYVVVDAAPGSGGAFTNPVSFHKGRKSMSKVFFSVRETDSDVTSVMTVSLQFRCKGDPDWQDFNSENALVAGDRKMIEDGGSGVDWRAGVKEGEYTSGSLRIGFDW